MDIYNFNVGLIVVLVCFQTWNRALHRICRKSMPRAEGLVGGGRDNIHKKKLS